tara:strand:+ start:150 stop:458 length:309 start_codon:yes stop_codon:yes gene_type:complete
MRQLYLSFIIILLFAAISITNSKELDLTRLVVKVPSLNSEFLKQKLELDFANIPGVSKCEISLDTKTMQITYESRKIKHDLIDKTFNKWDCYPKEYTYTKIY